MMRHVKYVYVSLWVDFVCSILTDIVRALAIFCLVCIGVTDVTITPRTRSAASKPDQLLNQLQPTVQVIIPFLHGIISPNNSAPICCIYYAYKCTYIVLVHAHEFVLRVSVDAYSSYQAESTKQAQPQHKPVGKPTQAKPAKPPAAPAPAAKAPASKPPPPPSSAGPGKEAAKAEAVKETSKTTAAPTPAQQPVPKPPSQPKTAPQRRATKEEATKKPEVKQPEKAIAARRLFSHSLVYSVVYTHSSTHAHIRSQTRFLRRVCICHVSMFVQLHR